MDRLLSRRDVEIAMEDAPNLTTSGVESNGKCVSAEYGEKDLMAQNLKKN